MSNAPFAVQPGQQIINIVTGGGLPIGGTSGQVLSKIDATDFNTQWTTISGTGTVTAVSVASANGFAGSVANPGTTPAITVSVTFSGLAKGNGAAMSAATPGDDYSAGTAALATGILKSTTTTGELSIAVAGDFPTLNQNTTGTAASVTGANVVANTNLAQMPANTFKANNTGVAANAADITTAQAKTLLAIVAADLIDFAATVRSTVLTGVSFVTNVAIVATDSVLVAFGKLQAQITGHFGVGGTTHPEVVAAGLSGFMSGADKTKLNGIATGATANSSDAVLLERSNHTGTQTALTISDFSASADARIALASINALSDVVITAPSATQVLKYNGTNWINDTDATGGGGVSDGDKGDITVSGAGATWTIDPATITLAKMANLAANSIIGNNTGAGATPIALTTTQVKTLLAIAAADVSGLGSLATASTVNLSTQATGALQAAQEPAHTGDVTNSAGSLVLAIASGVVTNNKLANVATATIKGRTTAGTGSPEDLSAAQTRAILNVADGATANSSDATLLARANHTGTQTAATISDFSTAADARIAAASINVMSDVVITTPSATQVLKYNGTNWINDTDATGGGGISDGDKGDITVSGSGATWTIDAQAVTLAKQANIAAARIMGRITAGAGVQEELTGTQATALMDTFTSALKGVAPASGGGTANFLRADGAWAAPAGGGGGGGVTVGVAFALAKGLY